MPERLKKPAGRRKVAKMAGKPVEKRHKVKPNKEVEPEPLPVPKNI